MQWASNGVALAPNGTSQEYPKITADGAGGAVFAWREYDSPEGIYTQRVSGLCTRYLHRRRARRNNLLV